MCQIPGDIHETWHMKQMQRENITSHLQGDDEMNINTRKSKDYILSYYI